MYDVIIKNGTIVTPSQMYKADIAIKDEKIATIGKDFPEDGAYIVDAEGKLVLPGAIDVHTHLSMPFGGTTSSDDYMAGTRAAACGGVTTVIDYAIQRKGQTIIETVNNRKALAEGKACVDYSFHCAITDLNNGKILEEFDKAAEEGITSLKCFMVYKKEGMMVDDGVLSQIMVKGKETGILTNVHAENPDMIDMLAEKYLSQGNTSPWYHYMSRPEFVEEEADIRAIHWAKAFNTPLYIVHLACKGGVEAVIKAKNEGHEIYAETCPQYLAFTNDVYKRDDAANFVCSPPIKGQESQDFLWYAVNHGYIDTIGTDHCPFQSSEKNWGKDDFTKIPNGCPGIENMYPFMLSAANQGKTTFNKVVEICASNPAKIFGCTGKGNLKVGSDADIVIYDPEKCVTISSKNMHSDSDNTIWEGVEVKGYPVQTFSRGKLVYNDGDFTGEPGWGNFLKRARRSIN